MLAAAILAAYLVAPVHIGYIARIHLRAVPFLVALAIDSAIVAQTRRTSALLAVVVALQVAYSAKLVRVYRSFDAEASPAHLEQVLHAAKPGRRLVGLMLHRKSKVVHFEPYLHFGLYYELERGGRVRFNFGELPWMPLRFRRDVPAQPLPLYWEFPIPIRIPRARSPARAGTIQNPDPTSPRAGLSLRARGDGSCSRSLPRRRALPGERTR